MKKDEIKRLALFYPLVQGVDNPVLRTKSTEITEFDSELIEFANILRELMYHYDGVGLAAPQLWKNIRMVATTQWKWKGKKQELIADQILINPTILQHSNDTLVFEEWCLSVPWVFGTVERFKEIKVHYYDEYGEEFTRIFSGYNAVIIQHEINHLEGILFVDKMIEDTSKKHKK